MLRNIFNTLAKPALFVISAGVLAFVVTYVMESRSVKSKNEMQKSTANRIEMSDVDLANFCKYDLEDYEALKPKVEQLFLDDPNIETANNILQSINNIEFGVKHNLPKITGKRFVLKDGKPTFSGEKLWVARLTCMKKNENKDLWHFVFHENAQGKILNLDFYITIDDENFAKRKVFLKPQYIITRKSINLAIISISQEHGYSVSQLSGYLKKNGFKVEKTQLTKQGEEQYKIIVENVRYWNRIYPLPGAKNGRFQLHIVADQSGKISRITK